MFGVGGSIRYLSRLCMAKKMLCTNRFPSGVDFAGSV